MPLRIIPRLVRSPNVRAAAGLGARFMTARLSALVTIALAAFVFPLDAFATFGTYSALLNLAWLAVFLRYEPAVISARSDREAGSVMRLCVAVGAATWVMSACVAAAVAARGEVTWGLGTLFCAALAARAALKLATALATRAGHAASIGDAAVAQAIGQTGLLAALAFLAVDGALALILSDLAGHAIAATLLAWRQRRSLAHGLGGPWCVRELGRCARENRALPLLNLPGALLALAFAQAPLLALPWIADRALAGALALALRLLDMPTQLIAAVLTPVIQHRLVRLPDPVERLPASILAALAAGVAGIYIAITLVILLAAPWLAATGLAGLAAIVPSVAVFQTGLAVAIPLTEACALYRDQRALAALQLAAFGAAAGCMAWALGGAPTTALTALAGVSVLRAGLIAFRLLALSRSR